jgi:hypothetical protein
MKLEGMELSSAPVMDTDFNGFRLLKFGRNEVFPFCFE